MDLVVPIWKRQGMTPLQAVRNFQDKNPQYKKEKVSYAGRLDPMAEGVMVLLIGAANKKRQEYEKLRKGYTAEIVFGVATDTYDSLGKVMQSTLRKMPQDAGDLINSFTGRYLQPFPPYSSKPVKGKPLYWWARNNRLSEISVPAHPVEVYTINIKDFSSISLKNLFDRIALKISHVEGDFRQKEILKAWEKLYKENKKEVLPKLTIEVECSSGTYIRGLAHAMGEKAGSGAFLYSLTRTFVGNYIEGDCWEDN